MRESCRFDFFISSKTDEACIYMSCYTLWQCSMGGVLQPLMIFGPVQEPCWTINQAVFLKTALHNFTTPLKRKMRLLYICTKPHKNQYQAPTRFSEDRVNEWGILNNGPTWTKRNNKFFYAECFFFSFFGVKKIGDARTLRTMQRCLRI